MYARRQSLRPAVLAAVEFATVRTTHPAVAGRDGAAGWLQPRVKVGRYDFDSAGGHQPRPVVRMAEAVTDQRGFEAFLAGRRAADEEAYLAALLALANGGVGRKRWPTPSRSFTPTAPPIPRSE